MLLLFNYQTLIDLIPSCFFTQTKTHSVFQTTELASAKVSTFVMTLITLFTTFSFVYLSTLSQFAHYKYFRTVLYTEVVLILVTGYIFCISANTFFITVFYLSFLYNVQER